MKFFSVGILIATMYLSAYAGSPACIGHPKPEACEAFEAKFASETPAQKAKRIHRLEQSRKAAHEQVMKDPAEGAKHRGVSIGMTRAEVLASNWGKPQRVHRTTNTFGTSEQWIYGGHNYLYFQDGVLTSIQN